MWYNCWDSMSVYFVMKPTICYSIKPTVSAFILTEWSGKSSKNSNEDTKTDQTIFLFSVHLGLRVDRSSDKIFLFLFKAFTLFPHMASQLSSNAYSRSAAFLSVRAGSGFPFSSQNTPLSPTNS